MKIPVKVLALVGACFLAAQSGAIIIRHDKGYGDYLVRESLFPSVFFLELQGRRKVCVATLIDPKWAITAAHCVKETSLLESINSGERFAVEVAKRQQSIDKIVVHPDYVPGAESEVDLALLRFTNEIEVPAVMPLNQSEEELGKAITIVGWGFFGLGTTGRQYDDGQFRIASNRIDVANERLQIRFDDPRDTGANILDLEGMPGLGDSGGPALLASGGGWVLAGVAVGELMDETFSEETQGSYGSIAIYERISKHHGWIRLTMEEDRDGSSD